MKLLSLFRRRSLPLRLASPCGAVVFAVVFFLALTRSWAQENAGQTSNTPRRYLEPPKSPLASPPPEAGNELILSREGGRETDAILRVYGDYPSTRGSLGRLMGDRKDPAYRDPAGKVVAFEVLKNGDVLFGPNTGVARRAENNDPDGCLETDPQHSSPIDFYWDARDRKLHVRSILLTENGDPADLAFRRSGDETYPYGPPMAIKAGTNLGTMYWMGWGAKDYGFNDRVAQIYAKSAEDITEKGAGGTLYLATTPLGTTKPLDRVVISSEGRVGVGTPTPQATLHVAGDAASDVTGLAEDYPSTEKLDAGDVVAIDEDAEKLSIKRAAVAYDPKLVGVVAANPALRISRIKEASAEPHPSTIEDGYPIPHGGRTTVKVSTENGAIRPGDYLTSSSTAGVAMKATAKGAVIGKALEPYAQEGGGKIQMLVDVTWFNP